MYRSLLTDEINELDPLDMRPFDQTDFHILKSYKSVVDGLAIIIGSHCEIVLHSLQDLECPVIRIANGKHTCREIGSSITDHALRMLHDMSDSDNSVSKCYFTRTKSGVLMKSISIAIRNSDRRLIGILCINMNLDMPFSQIISTFIPSEMPADIDSLVNFTSSVNDLVTQTLEFTVAEVNADRNVSNNAKNRQIVLNLYEKGIFNIKDALSKVAERLNISKHTVYLYIRQFKNSKKQKENK